MSRHLRRAALAAAAAAALSAVAMRSASEPSSDARYANIQSSPEYRAAPGHLALARAHPSLGALLTPEAFLLDATHALAAAALRVHPLCGETIRLMHHDPRGAALIAKHLAEIGPERASGFRLRMALLDAQDGRFEDALDALARLAAERPSDPRPRLAAAGICYLAGLMEEGNQWVSEIPESVRWDREHKTDLQDAVLAATLGGAPRAVAGFEGLVGWAAYEVMDLALLTKVVDGEMTFLKRMILLAFLQRVVADKYMDYYKGMVAGAPSKE